MPSARTTITVASAAEQEHERVELDSGGVLGQSGLAEGCDGGQRKGEHDGAHCAGQAHHQVPCHIECEELPAGHADGDQGRVVLALDGALAGQGLAHDRQPDQRGERSEDPPPDGLWVDGPLDRGGRSVLGRGAGSAATAQVQLFELIGRTRGYRPRRGGGGRSTRIPSPCAGAPSARTPGRRTGGRRGCFRKGTRSRSLRCRPPARRGADHAGGCTPYWGCCTRRPARVPRSGRGSRYRHARRSPVATWTMPAPGRASTGRAAGRRRA